MSTTVEDKLVTLAGWKKNAVHEVLCPSGTRVTIRIPNLARMISAGAIPQHLLDAALGVASGQQATPTVELIKQQSEFTDALVLKAVVAPKLSADDLDDVPYEDMEFIVSIATRARDLDAAGRHIAGLSDLEEFRRFRKLGEFDEDVEGL